MKSGSSGSGGGPELLTEAGGGAVISAVGALHMGRYEGPRDAATQGGGGGSGGPRWFRSAGDAPLSILAARVRSVLMQLSSGTSGETVHSFCAASGTTAAAAVAVTQSVNTVAAAPHTQGAHLLQELMLLLEGVAVEAASEPQASDHLTRHPTSPAPFSTPSSSSSSSQPQHLPHLSRQRQLISDSLPLVTHSLTLLHGLVQILGQPALAAAAAAATTLTTSPATTITTAANSNAAARVGDASGAPGTGSGAVGIAGGGLLTSPPPTVASVNSPGRALLVMVVRMYRRYSAYGQQYEEAVLGPLGAVLAEVLALMEQHQLKVGSALLDHCNPHMFTHVPPPCLSTPSCSSSLPLL